MMIKLLNRDNEVIYEVEKSELFQDYRSVLKDALACGVDLSNLFIDSECIDEVVWNGVNFNNVGFKNCSMRKNTMVDCSNSDFSSFSIRNSSINNGFIIDSECSKSSFFESSIHNLSFHSSNISEIIFNRSNLYEVRFIHSKTSNKWIKDARFLYCVLSECEMNYVDDISVLFFWEIDWQSIRFKENKRFTEIKNTNSRVLYAVDSDIVWWKPHLYECDNEFIFRGTLNEFQQEINSGFTTTNIYPEMDDFDIEDELLKTCVFLKLWRDKNFLTPSPKPKSALSSGHLSNDF